MSPASLPRARRRSRPVLLAALVLAAPAAAWPLDPLTTQYLDALRVRPEGLCDPRVEARLGPCFLWRADPPRPAGTLDLPLAAALAADAATLVLAGGAAASKTSSFRPFAAAVRAEDGAPLWRADLPASRSDDVASAVVAVPGGDRVVVSGNMVGAWVAALRASDGALLWRVEAPGLSGVPAAAPDGATVYLPMRDQVHARAAADGALRWAAAATGRVWALAVAPDGGTVYAAGDVEEDAARTDLALTAHRAADGTPRWSTRVDGTGDGASSYHDHAVEVAATPDGQRVVAAGYLPGSGGSDVVAVGFDASDGAHRWTSRLDNDAREFLDFALAGDGARAFLAARTSSNTNWHLSGVDVLTGVRLWRATYTSPTLGNDDIVALAASHDGTRVYAAGTSDDGPPTDVATAAFEALTGSMLWVERFTTPGSWWDVPTAAAVTPDDRRVLVAGHVQPQHETASVVLAYDARDLEDLARRALPG